MRSEIPLTCFMCILSPPKTLTSYIQQFLRQHVYAPCSKNYHTFFNSGIRKRNLPHEIAMFCRNSNLSAGRKYMT